MSTYTIEWLKNPGGVNASTHETLIADNEFAYGTLNIIPNKLSPGGLMRRPGIAVVGAGAVADDFVGSIYKGKLGSYYTDQGDPSFIVRSCTDGTALSTTANTSTTPPCWRSHNSQDLCVNGSMYLKTADGTTFSTLSGIPAGAKYIESYNQYLFCAGHSGNILRWADIGTTETWTATNTLTIEGATSDAITGIKRHNDKLFIFLSDMYVVLQGYSTNTFSIPYINTHVGSLHNNANVSTPHGLFFWSKHGIARTIDGVNVDFPMLRKGAYYLQSLLNYDGINACYKPDESVVRFYVPKVGIAYTNALRFDYYPVEDALYVQSGRGCCMTASACFQNSSNVWLQYCGGHTSGSTDNLYYENTPSVFSITGPDDDAGNAITATILTKRHSLNTIAYTKKAISSWLQVKASHTIASGALTYGIYANEDTSLTRSWTATPGVTTWTRTRHSLNVEYAKLQHSISDATKGALMEYLPLVETGEVQRPL